MEVAASDGWGDGRGGGGGEVCVYSAAAAPSWKLGTGCPGPPAHGSLMDVSS